MESEFLTLLNEYLLGNSKGDLSSVLLLLLFVALTVILFLLLKQEAKLSQLYQRFILPNRNQPMANKPAISTPEKITMFLNVDYGRIKKFKSLTFSKPDEKETNRRKFWDSVRTGELCDPYENLMSSVLETEEEEDWELFQVKWDHESVRGANGSNDPQFLLETRSDVHSMLLFFDTQQQTCIGRPFNVSVRQRQVVN